MTGMNLKPIACALTIVTIGSAAMSGAGCNADGTTDSLVLGAGPVVQYAGASGAAAPTRSAVAASAESSAAERPTHAEVRHYAIYRRYRDMFGSSGGGFSENASSCGAADDGSDNFLLWGSRLLGIEHLFCASDGRGK